MRKYTFLWALAAVGVLMHLGGIGVDAYLHGRDTTLAAREGIFTMGNPGHVLIFGGFSLTAASLMGIALVWLNTKRVGGNGPVARILRTATMPAMALAAAGSVWALSLGEGTATHTETHDAAVAHVDSPVGQTGAVVAVANGDHGHTATNAAGGSVAASPMGEAGGHHGNEIPVTPDQLVAAADFYAKVKVSAAQYESVKDAMALGYIQITQDLPGIAAHFYHPVWSRDGQLMNPDRPEVLLFTKRMDGNWRLAGFMFSAEKVNDSPPSFFGPLDAWHRHENLCFTGAGVSVKPNKDACVGGVFTAVTAWQMHVWTAPGATTGVFAHDFPPISPGGFPAATRGAAQDVLVRAP